MNKSYLDKRKNSLANLTWSVIGKQTAKRKRSIDRLQKRIQKDAKSRIEVFARETQDFQEWLVPQSDALFDF